MWRTRSSAPAGGRDGGQLERLQRRRLQAERGAAGGELAVGAGNGTRRSDPVGGRDLRALHLAPVVLVEQAGDARVAERAVGEAARVEEAEHEAGRELVQVQQHLGRRVAVDAGDALRRDVVGEADEEVEPERRGDLVCEVAPERPALRVDAPDQLALVPAERDPVVAVARARLPRRLLRRDRRADAVEVEQVVEVEALVDRAQSRLVREQLAHGDALLAGRAELRPVLRHGRVVVEQAAAVGDGDRHRRDALGGREHRDERVLLPRRLRHAVAVAAPQVDDLAAVAVDRDGRADLIALREVGPEGVGDRAVPLVGGAQDVSPARPRGSGCRRDRGT